MFYVSVLKTARYSKGKDAFNSDLAANPSATEIHVTGNLGFVPPPSSV